MNSPLLLQRLAWSLVVGIVVTIPLLFGAVHPLILGVYVFVILVGVGGFLLFSTESDLDSFSSLWVILPVLFLSYLLFQIVPLPLSLVEIFSPARAERVGMVNTLAGAGVTLASISDKGTRALPSIISLFAILIYYLGLVQLLRCEKKRIILLCYCLIGVGSVEAVYGLLQFVNPHIGILWLKQTVGRAAYGTIIYKNQYASLLNMIWPLAVACGALYFLKSKRSRTSRKSSKLKDAIDEVTTTKVQAPVFLFCSALMLLAIFFSLSRGGILSMVFIGIFLLCFMPFSRKIKLLFVTLFALLVAGYGSMLGLDTIVARFSTISQSGSTRFEVYLASLPMLFEHWFAGIGMGSYALLSPVYLKGFPPNILFDRVHNEYLELFIEIGIPMATFFFLWLFGGTLKLFLSLINTIKEERRRRDYLIIGTASFGGFLGFLIHGLVDFGWRLPANLVYAVTLLAITVSCLDISHKKNRVESTLRSSPHIIDEKNK